MVSRLLFLTQAEHPPEAVVAQHVLFKSLMVQLSYFQAEAKEAKSHFDKLASEADMLRDGRQEFEESAVVRFLPFPRPRPRVFRSSIVLISYRLN